MLCNRMSWYRMVQNHADLLIIYIYIYITLQPARQCSNAATLPWRVAPTGPPGHPRWTLHRTLRRMSFCACTCEAVCARGGGSGRPPPQAMHRCARQALEHRQWGTCHTACCKCGLGAPCRQSRCRNWLPMLCGTGAQNTVCTDCPAWGVLALPQTIATETCWSTSGGLACRSPRVQ